LDILTRALRPRFARLPVWLTLAAVFAILAADPPPAAAQLAQEETPDLRLVFIDPTLTFLVPYATRAFENALRMERQLFDFTPHEKITVLLVDLADYGNGGVSVVPRTVVQVQVAPVSHLFETVPPAERMSFIMNHELVHAMTMDQAAGRDRFFRRLFAGKVSPVAEQPESILYFYLTTPRVASPAWYLEGSATFFDTWMDGGIGRSQGGWDEMVFRSMVRDGARFYDPLGLAAEGAKVDFQQRSNAYLYGERFMSWLAYTYSPQSLVTWLSRKPGTRAYYASEFQQVFGRTIESAWSDWVASEKTFQQANLTAIRAYPITPYQDLSPRALGSVSRAYFDAESNRIVGAFSYPGVPAHVGSIALADGSLQRFVDIKGPRQFHVASVAWDARDRAIFYTTDNDKHRDLVRLDPGTGQTRVLQKDLRVGELAFDRASRALYGVRSLNGLATIVRIPPPYTEWTRLVTLPYGTIAYDLDVSPDGTLVAATFGDPTGRQTVRVIKVSSLEQGDATPINEFDFGGAVPDNFVFSPDGRYLYGSSYYTGASNLFRYELATKTIEAVTNAETGFMRPIPLGNDELIAFRYTGAGFVPVRLTATPIKDINPVTFFGQRTVEKHPVLRSWAAGSPASMPYEDVPKTRRKYGLAGGLMLESIVPIVQGYKDTQALGARVQFSDPVMLNRLFVSASYSPWGDIAGGERPHLRADYQRYDWHATASLNNADFFDLFGPTKMSRKGYDFTVGHTNTLVFDEPHVVSLYLEGSLAGNLDQLPEYQNVPVVVDRLLSFKADLTSHDVHSSIGNVDDERGTSWSMVARGDYVNHDTFLKVHGTYDVSLGMPLPHSSIWLRSAAGFSPQSPHEPFANFFFGGFGNNYVDHRNEKQYRDYSSFPGAAIDEFGGRNFVRSTIEWNLPPLRFSRAGTPGAYLSWMRPAFFVSGLAANLDDPRPKDTAVTAGTQFDFNLTVLSQLDLVLSAGGAVAVARDGIFRPEALISLRLLKSPGR
jgi:hypothetical protein